MAVNNPQENSNKPSEVTQQHPEILAMPDLRIITPHEIVKHLDDHWGETSIIKGYVPKGWHGEFDSEGERRHGDIVLLPQLLKLAGTRMRTRDFVDFLTEEGFSPQHNGESAGRDEVADALDSKEEPQGGIPVFRALRPMGQGKPPMEIDIFSGLECPPVQRVTEIGNMPKGMKTEKDKQEYIEAFKKLLPFIAKGTTQARVRMGLGDHKVPQRRFWDDCKAGNTSSLGLYELEYEENKGYDGRFLIQGAGINTLQSMVTDVWWANKRGNEALGHLVLGGTISRGLGGPKEGTMYMINTTSPLLEKGLATSGDIGDNTDTEESRTLKPVIIKNGNGSPDYFNVIVLRGGLFVLYEKKNQHDAISKPFEGLTGIYRGSRIDNSPLLPPQSFPTQWGIVVNRPQ